MTTFRYMAVLVCAMSLSACEKNAIQDIAAPAPSARIKFFNFGVNAPGVNFYANETKMTAISSTTGAESTTGVAYNGAGNGGLYSGIAPGQYTFKGKIAAATDKDLAISNVPTTIADGKSYSYFQSGIYSTATKTVDAFVVEDAFPAAIDYSVALVRFVNAISGTSPASLSVKNQTTGTVTAIGGAVGYKSAGAFTVVPNGVYDLAAAFPGAGIALRTGVSFVAGRTYTIGARGDITATTGANVPALDNTANR
jgi:Domain of unknown function (DUF4397)